jgi:hypothetical protein
MTDNQYQTELVNNILLTLSDNKEMQKMLVENKLLSGVFQFLVRWLIKKEQEAGFDLKDPDDLITIMITCCYVGFLSKDIHEAIVKDLKISKTNKNPDVDNLEGLW